MIKYEYFEKRELLSDPIAESTPVVFKKALMLKCFEDGERYVDFRL